MQPGLPFSGLHPRNPWINTHLPTREGWKAELAWKPDKVPTDDNIVFNHEKFV